MRKLARFFGGVILGAVFIAGFFAYLVTAYNPNTGQYSDGFGRQLSVSPLLMRTLLGEDRLWAGWVWFAVDMVLFWGGIGLGFTLVSIKSSEENSE